jgi:hypothetical protein
LRALFDRLRADLATGQVRPLTGLRRRVERRLPPAPGRTACRADWN